MPNLPNDSTTYSALPREIVADNEYDAVSEYKRSMLPCFANEAYHCELSGAHPVLPPHGQPDLPANQSYPYAA